jgi:hypothetical protein
MLEGVVHCVEGNIIRFADGGWRYLTEGLPFASREDAETYAAEHTPEDEEPASGAYRRDEQQQTG